MTAKATYSTDIVLAASLAADRINAGEYKKFSFDLHRANKAIIAEALTNPDIITQADHDGVQAMREYFHGLVAKIFTETITDFERKMLDIANSTEISPTELGITAYMPCYYNRETVKAVAKDRLLDCTREYLAPVTSKIQATLEILGENVSLKYNCRFFSAVTDSNCRVFFAYSGAETLNVGSKYLVKAMVKRHDDNWTTVLGRVKPAKI